MKVAVIGAGISGLFCIKSCLEDNLNVQCFEKTDQLGGAWVHRSQFEVGDPASVYQGLKCNTSNLLNEASDFPSHILDDLPTWQQQLDYTQQYAKHFGLDKHITFNCTVISVEPEGDDWLVTRSENDEVKTDKFNAVLVCSGRFNKPIIPDILGIETFQGRILTSNAFKHNRQIDFIDKRVLVIGNSITAGDISALLADTAKQVYLSIGSGCTLISIYQDNVTLDTLVINRGLVYTRDPLGSLRTLVSNAKKTFPDQDKYGIQPGGDLIVRPFLYTAQDLTGLIRSGRILVKPRVTELTETGAVFNDGTTIEVDTILTATGYDTDFPFLSKDIIAETASDLKLYKLMWPITTRRHNLVIVGCIKVIGPVTPFVELQSRWAVAVIQNKVALPNREIMSEEIERRNTILTQMGKNLTQTDGPVLLYQDFMAAEIGALPTWWHYLLTNPLLAYIIRYGPAFNSTYRLVGPHKWRKADARTVELYRRWREKKDKGSMLWPVVSSMGAIVAVALGIWWIKHKHHHFVSTK